MSASASAATPSSRCCRSRGSSESLRRCAPSGSRLRTSETRRRASPPAACRWRCIVDVAKHVAERVRPAFLMTAGQMRVALRGSASSSDGSFGSNSLAGARSPIHSSFCCSCFQRSDVFLPFTSNHSPFLCPAHTWPTETHPFAPPSNRSEHRREVFSGDRRPRATAGVRLREGLASIPAASAAC